jgi:hypothetical protein
LWSAGKFSGAGKMQVAGCELLCFALRFLCADTRSVAWFDTPPLLASVGVEFKV